MQKSQALEAMWLEYKRTQSVALRNQIVEAYLPLVDYLAERISERLPRYVDVDEVRSAGVLGLLDAVEGFELDRGIKFETYCSVRVRGAILDELRSRDWVPRLVRSRAQKFAVAVRRLSSKLGRKPTPDEMMRELQLPLGEFEEIMRDLARIKIYSLDLNDQSGEDEDGRAYNRTSSLVDRREPQPEDLAHSRDASQVVLNGMDERTRRLFELYYFKGLSMKEIGAELGIHGSRVCQIHGKVLLALRKVFATVAEDCNG